MIQSNQQTRRERRARRVKLSLTDRQLVALRWHAARQRVPMSSILDDLISGRLDQMVSSYQTNRSGEA